MSSNDRITRPPLPRREPHRTWPGMPAGIADGVNEAVSRAVDLGYRVVDEYIRQGQRAAEQLGLRMAGPGATGSAADAQEVAVRMAQYTSDAFAVWLQFVGAAMGAAAPRPATAPMPRGWESLATNGAASHAVRLLVEVAGSRRVEVTVDLEPGTNGRALTVQALRATDPDKPRLTDVRLEPAAGVEPATLIVRIPDGQPADRYGGIVVDAASGRLAGTVTVRLAD
jgi:hypothetical protein